MKFRSSLLIAISLGLFSACGRSKSDPTAAGNVEQKLNRYIQNSALTNEDEAKALLIEGAEKLGGSNQLVQNAADAVPDLSLKLLPLRAILGSDKVRFQATKKLFIYGLEQRDPTLLRFSLRSFETLSNEQKTELAELRKKSFDYLLASKSMVLTPTLEKVVTGAENNIAPLSPTTNAAPLLKSAASGLKPRSMTTTFRLDPDLRPIRGRDCSKREDCFSSYKNSIAVETENIKKLEKEILGYRNEIDKNVARQNQLRRANEPDVESWMLLREKRSKAAGGLEVATINVERLNGVLKKLKIIRSRKLSIELETMTQETLADLGQAGKLAEFKLMDVYYSTNDDDLRKQLKELLDILQIVGLNETLLASISQDKPKTLESDLKESGASEPTSILQYYFGFTKALSKTLATFETDVRDVSDELQKLYDENASIIKTNEEFLNSTTEEAARLEKVVRQKEVDVATLEDQVKTLQSLIQERKDKISEAANRQNGFWHTMETVCKEIPCEQTYE